MPAKVCFSFFDPIVGPVPVWHPGISPTFARKLATQAHVAVASTADLMEGPVDAVLPFPQQDVSAYIYLFQPLSQFNEKEEIIALSLVVDQVDQDRLYSNMSSIRQEAEKIAVKINEHVSSIPRKDSLLAIYRKTILTLGLQRLLKDWSKQALVETVETKKESYQVVPTMVLPGIETLNPDLKATIPSLEEEMRETISIFSEEPTAPAPTLEEKMTRSIHSTTLGAPPIAGSLKDKDPSSQLERIRRIFWAYSSQDSRVKALLLLINLDRPMSIDALAKATGQNQLLFKRWLLKMAHLKFLKVEDDTVELLIY